MDLNCRVCLQVRGIMVDLFEEVDQFQTNFAALLEEGGGMKVHQNDLYPKYLCHQCTQELLVVARFREKCQNTMKLLREMQENASTVSLVDKTDQISNKTDFTNDDCSLPENSKNEDLFEKCVIEYENEAQPSPECNSNLDAFNINIIYDKPSYTDKLMSSTTACNENMNNIHQLVVHTNNQTSPLRDPSEETYTENTVITVNYDRPINIYDSLDLTDEFADNIIEELTNEDSELDCNRMESEHSGIPSESTENYKFTCEMCGASFVKFFNFRRHIEFAHNATLEFFCEKCCRIFEAEKDLTWHKEMNCQEFKQMESQSLMEITESNKKRKESHSKYSCDYCGKCLQSFFSLRMHVRTHTGERPFSCDICQSQFKTQAALTAHQKRHTGNAEFVCEICDKRFYDQSNLKTHRRIHTGYKPHTCNVCNKSFTRVYLLQLHMRTHTGERPFKCEVCYKTFSQNSDLKYHLAIHNDDRKYLCIICSKTFIRKSQLESHMQRHIGNTPKKNIESNTKDLTEGCQAAKQSSKCK